MIFSNNRRTSQKGTCYTFVNKLFTNNSKFSKRRHHDNLTDAQEVRSQNRASIANSRSNVAVFIGWLVEIAFNKKVSRERRGQREIKRTHVKTAGFIVCNACIAKIGLRRGPPRNKAGSPTSFSRVIPTRKPETYTYYEKLNPCDAFNV